MDTVTAAGTARRAAAARAWKRRRPHRGRRLRVVAAAGFAGVTVALLAAQGPVATPGPTTRFTVQPLVSDLLVVPVRFADAASAAFLRPGDRVDVLAADDAGGPGPGLSRSVPDALAATAPAPDAAVATDVSVLEIAGSGQRASRSPTPLRSTDGDDGLVFLAVDNATAERLARAAARERLSYALHPPREH